MKVHELSIEEFATSRRKAQDAAIAYLLPFVREALPHIGQKGWLDDLRDAAAVVYVDAYRADGGEGDPKVADFRRFIWQALNRTKKGSSAQSVATMIAVAAINAATIQAANDDPEDLFLEWVTMHDNDVRPAHQQTDGQVRPIGEPFDVDGVPMRAPGDTRAPIELWINCRCVLRPTLAGAFSFKDYTPEQRKKAHTLPDGSYPIEDCQDLKNAIQAIGRAKDPAKAKAHIRSRKSSLGCPEVTLPDTWANEGVDMTDDTDMGTPWHGVLAPEGIRSGDGRMFAEGSLSGRPLPLPLTWQKMSDDGHKGNITVARIDAMEVVDGQMRASGNFLTTPEADEVIGLLGEFGQFGVSVDADDAVFELDDSTETVVFTQARVSGACIVPIPAFAEAFVTLGKAPWMDEEGEERVAEEPVAPDTGEKEDEDEKKKAPAFSTDWSEIEQFVDVAPGRTEDGPGWLTHPVDTDRLRDYWVRGPGAAKIGWGSPGDFNRCRLQLAKYVKPQYLNGYCANRHFDALGFWPGPSAHSTVEGEQADAISLTASVGHRAPAVWFKDPGFTEPTPLTITDEGQVYGHLATWDSCHLAFPETCTAPPRSETNYAYFLTGAVALDDGTTMPVGNITIGGPHAGPRLSMMETMRHYDTTSRVVADVTCGDDEVGIWVTGWIRPGATDEQVTALRASALSGDWRKAGGNLELVAALAVNVPGFGIPRIQIAASSEGQLSLVASGIVAPAEDSVDERIDYPALAELIAQAIVDTQARAKQMAELRERFTDAV